MARRIILWSLCCVMGLASISVISSAEKEKTARVTLKTVSWNGVEKLVKQHKGKIVVLDIWTTTCGKCREEFPAFVKLQKTFSRKKVVCISVNCDYDGIESKPPKFYRKQVIEFLTKHNATFDNVMLDIAFIEFLEKRKLRSTPAIYVYDRDGKLAHRFDNDKIERVEDEFTMKQVEELVQQLLMTKKDKGSGK